MSKKRRNISIAEHPAVRTTLRSTSEEFPAWFDLLAILAIFFVATIAGAFSLIAIRKIAPTADNQMLTAIAYSIQFLLAIVAICFYRYWRGGRGRIFRFSIKWYNSSLVFLGLILMFATSVVMEPFLNLFPDHFFETLNKSVGSGGWAILSVVLLAPVFEEMLFRGLVLELARSRWGTGAAILISSLFFGIVHFPILPQMLNAFVMGIMLGYVYVLTDSLISVIIIHATNNALAYLLVEITGTQAVDLKEIVGNNTLYWVIYVVSFVIFLALLISMAVIASDRWRKKREIASVFIAVPSLAQDGEVRHVEDKTLLAEQEADETDENKTSAEVEAEGNNKE